MGESTAGPLSRVERLLEDLKVQIDMLHAMAGRLEEAQDWEMTVMAEENEVSDMLTQAELTQDLTSMRSARETGDEMRGQVLGTFDTLVQGLCGALESALTEASSTHKSLEQMVNEATSMLVQRKTALDVAAKRAQVVMEERALESTQGADDEPLSYEETRAFDESCLEVADRRKHPRDLMAVEVRLEDDGSTISGSTENLSAGGLFISTAGEFELGTLLHVSCTLPDGRVVRADGLVSWMRSQESDVDPGIGVEFLALSDEDRQLLERLDHP
jgi:uncharacterized protein (TIGR02266 family)